MQKYNKNTIDIEKMKIWFDKSSLLKYILDIDERLSNGCIEGIKGNGYTNWFKEKFCGFVLLWFCARK